MENEDIEPLPLSELCAPVWVGDELWGAINVEELEPHAFDEDDARLLQTVADQLGSALRSALLYEQLDRAYLGTAEALAAALEAKDSYTAQHAHSIVQWAEAVGRRLDFLCQELNREANTLCSKSADIDLTRIGLSLKAGVEQFREQVQNIE